MMRHGFSLVELSIVLVILGLLTGGILAGQSLIRASELRAISTEYNRWVTATNSFRDKYFALPADMTNATKFWQSAPSCPGTAGTGTQTCDGNGNGMIDIGPTANAYSENFTFWQHLANAGLIEGSYTGIAGAGVGFSATTDNSPRSKMNPGLWFAWNWNQTFTGNAAVFDGTYRDNMLQIGGFAAGGSPGTPLLKPEEAWNIDTKLDDGRPGYGTMRERRWDDCTDATSSANIAANYALTVTSSQCTPLFYMK